MSYRHAYVTEGSSSSPTRGGTHSPAPLEPNQVFQSIETPVKGKSPVLREDQAASQQLANEQRAANRPSTATAGYLPNLTQEQLAAIPSSASATATVTQPPRTVIDLATNDTSEPDPSDYAGLAVEGLDGNWLDNSVCTIIVGEGEKRDKLAVHEKLLLAKSPYFVRILQASGKPTLGEIFLNDVDVHLFKLLVRWMYGTALGRVFRFDLPDDEVTIHDYIGLYVLASQLEIPAAKNCIIDTIYNYYAQPVEEVRCPAVADVRMVLENLPEDSQLERLLMAHMLFACFSKKRGDAPLPDDWDLLRRDGRIGHGLITMLNEWRWTMGKTVPPMILKDRFFFHELDETPVSTTSQIRVVIKTEPGADNGNNDHHIMAPPVAQPARRAPRAPVADQDLVAVAQMREDQIKRMNAMKQQQQQQQPAANNNTNGPRPPKRPAAAAAQDAETNGPGPASAVRPAKRPAGPRKNAKNKAPPAPVPAAGTQFLRGSSEHPINL